MTVHKKDDIRFQRIRVRPLVDLRFGFSFSGWYSWLEPASDIVDDVGDDADGDVEALLRVGWVCKWCGSAWMLERGGWLVDDFGRSCKKGGSTYTRNRDSDMQGLRELLH